MRCIVLSRGARSELSDPAVLQRVSDEIDIIEIEFAQRVVLQRGASGQREIARRYMHPLAFGLGHVECEREIREHETTAEMHLAQLSLFDAGGLVIFDQFFRSER